jgi:hypothetical protein
MFLNVSYLTVKWSHVVQNLLLSLVSPVPLSQLTDGYIVPSTGDLTCVVIKYAHRITQKIYKYPPRNKRYGDISPRWDFPGVDCGCQGTFTHRRTRRGKGQLPPPQKKNFRKQCKFGQMLGKTNKIREDLPENRLNSGYFITIFHKNLGKLSIAP